MHSGSPVLTRRCISANATKSAGLHAPEGYTKACRDAKHCSPKYGQISAAACWDVGRMLVEWVEDSID